jgi:hypothetical protein
MPLIPGQTALRRTLHPDGRIGTVQSARVVADDDAGLRLWVAAGSQIMRRVGLDGRPVRHLPWAEELHIPTTLAPAMWGPHSSMMLMPPDAGYSVWWSWAPDGAFSGWYVNIEQAVRKWSGGIDVLDLTLDLLVAPDGAVQLKDEDELAEQTADPHFWDADGATRIRAEADMLAQSATAKCFPFDGTWSDVDEFVGLGEGTLPWWWEMTAAMTRGAGSARGLVVTRPDDPGAVPSCRFCGR